MLLLALVVAVVVIVVLVASAKSDTTVRRNPKLDCNVGSYKWSEHNTDVKQERKKYYTLAEVELELTEEQVWDLLSREYVVTDKFEYRLADVATTKLLYTKVVR